MSDLVELSNDHWRVRLNPHQGGTVLEGRAAMDGQWYHVLRPTPELAIHTPADTASYPLVPWSNRIRDGVLTWNGRDHQLRINFPDGTAIHGTGMEFPWQVTSLTADSATFSFDSHQFVGVNFPWNFTADLTYRLEGNRWTWGMAVTNVDTEAFPAGLGHHPYFVRHVIGESGHPTGEAVQLEVDVERGYALERCMPDAAAGPIPSHADFRELRNLGTDFVDDCLTARTGERVARLVYPGALEVAIEADAVFEHVVVYIPVGEDFFAVEPVTNANDGINLMNRGIDGHGVQIVEPGQTLAGEFTLVALPGPGA